MKKAAVLLLALACVLGLTGCRAKLEYNISVVVPAGNQGELVYSDEEIAPFKRYLTVKSIDLSEKERFVLKPVGEEELAFTCTDFPKGVPMVIEVDKGAWYKIGVAMENPADEDIVVSFHVESVKVRIE